MWNRFRGNDTLVLADGLDVFRSPVPPALAGKSLAAGAIRTSTGCNVVAIDAHGRLRGNPKGDEVLEAGTDLILIGGHDERARFTALHARPSALRGPRRRGATDEFGRRTPSDRQG